MLIFVSDNLKKLAKIFPVDLYIVGGYVRNQIMGLPKTDVDLCGQLKLEEVSSLLQGSMFSFKVKNLAWKGNEVRYVFVSCALVLIILLGFLGLAVTILLYILLSIFMYRKQADNH